MKVDLIDALAAPRSDPEFGKKYAITVVCSVLSVLVLPAVLLVGYLGATIKHASSGKKGLPEWSNLTELAVQGGVGFLACLYMLPGALLFAIGYLPRLGAKSFFSMGNMLSNFISFGALLVGLAGLAFTLTGYHSYLTTRQIGDVFNLGKSLEKIKAHGTEMGMLLAMVGVVAAGCSILSVLISWLGGLVSLLAGAFLNLVLAWGVGNIYRQDAAAPALPATPEPTALTTPDVVELGLPATEEEDTWKPK